MSRSTILEKLRQHARLARAADLPSELPSFPCYPDPVFQFRTELERVSGIFLDGRTPDLLATAFETVLQASRSHDIYWEGEELFAKHAIEYRLRNPEVFEHRHLVLSRHPLRQIKFPLMLDSCPYNRQTMADISVSASSAVSGIAETGTIVETARAGTGRLMSVLTPVHVSLLREKDILMNHAEFFSGLKPGEDGSYLVLVSGPSRTADIEKTLVLGVHGPQLHYVILT